MKKKLVAAVCFALAVATAAPALALENTVTGFFRQKGIVADLLLERDSNKSPDWLIDQRLRARWNAKVNDYLSFVYFAEVDFSWGDSVATGGTRNSGGGLDGDAVNVETKNLYMIAKIPNTPITVSSGLQTFADNWEGVLSPAFDMAGIRVDVSNLANLGNLTVGWFKLAEGEVAEPSVGGQFRREDDANLWAVRFAMKPLGALKLGADFYYVQNQDVTTVPPSTTAIVDADPATPGVQLGPAPGVQHSAAGFRTPGREDLYYLGANVGYKVGMIDVNGFAFYNFGKMHNAVLANPAVPAGALEDVDVSAWVATIKAAVSGKTWGAGARVIYYSADDDASDKDQNFIRNPLAAQAINSRGAVTAQGAWPTWGGEGLNIMLGDVTAATGYVGGATAGYAGNGVATGDAANKGFGLVGLVLNGVFSPPAMPDLYFKGAVGYFQALEKDRGLNNTTIGNANDNIQDHDGKVIGTELSVRVGYKIAKNLDVSISGAQAWLGDFYNKTASATAAPGPAASAGLFGATKTDPDNPYIAYWLATLTF